MIDKPAGVLSVPGKGPDKQVCAASMVAERFPHATGPLVVHRLDMDTSGLMVFGLDEHAQRDLSAQFERRAVEKRYTAVVAGHIAGESGEIDVPMRLDPDNRPVQVVDLDLGRPSRTLWKLMALEPEGSRLELTPITGRTHQLRVHLAHIGHPIMGDVLYGPQPATASAAERLLLHASFLSFRKPAPGDDCRMSRSNAGARVEFASPPPF